MRVLLVIDSFFTGGAEFSTLEFFGYLVKISDVEIKICKLKSMNPEYDPKVFGLGKELIETLPSGSFCKKRKALRQIVDEFKPQIVHSVLFKANLLVRSVRMFNKSFVHLESLVNHTYSDNRLREIGVTRKKLEIYRLLDKYTSYLGTDHFHPNGFSVAKHYQEKLGISERKMSVVHRGRDGEKYKVIAADRMEFGISPDKIILINVARQEYQKGQDVLLNALELLSEEILNRIHLLVVGREGKMTESLQKQLKSYQLQDKVSFLGHRTDIPALLGMADVFVFPSRFEGLPGVLIEAEASGLPIICTDLPMMREVVEVDKNAYIFEIDNPEALAQNIEKMIKNVEVMQSFSKKSKEIFKNKFENEMVHKKMFFLYQKLINR